MEILSENQTPEGYEEVESIKWDDFIIKYTLGAETIRQTIPILGKDGKRIDIEVLDVIETSEIGFQNHIGNQAQSMHVHDENGNYAFSYVSSITQTPIREHLKDEVEDLNCITVLKKID